MEANIYKNNRSSICIDLSIANLPTIKVGMFWYDDNTVSEELVADKKVKSVILAVRGTTIYGDTFIEATKSIQEVRTFIKTCGVENACHLTYREMAFIMPHVQKINAALASLDKPLWKGWYMTATEFACYRYWVYEMPRGVRTCSNQVSAKVRLVFCYDVE